MDLKWWNEKTYEEIKAYLDKGERCAITNATGTGKTSITTKIIREYDNGSHILVIAPRKPILDQYHNELYGISDKKNIEYMTFATLGIRNKEGALDTDEYKDINIIIIDELHRSGAKTWLPAIEKLIVNNPKAYVLGASATPKRLDQKYQAEDMIDILFDGNRCGEYDLRTCIREGILPTPIYVSTLYSIDEEEKKLLDKIETIDTIDKSKFIDDIKEASINWEESKNKERVIRQFLTFRNMNKRNTKILVFCKNVEHIKIIREQFDPIFKEMYKDLALSISEYHSYTKNDGFNDFKNLNFDGLVQILYTIDKFNEGIHIDGLDGIIMLRETQSETVYYQQLGRVLSLSGRDHPVIIDIVNNSEKVKAFDYLQDVMKEYISVPKNITRGETERDIPVGFYNYVRDINELFHSIEERIIENQLYFYKGEKGTIKYFSNKYNRDIKVVYKKVKVNKMTIEEAIETTEELSGLNVTWNGYSGSLEDVCRKFKVNHALIKYRMDNRNLTFEEAMKTVIKK